MKKSYFIYILKLENGFWYVGRSSKNVSSRIRQHVKGTGSAWTKLHPVHAVHAIYEGNQDEERLATLDLMKIHGFSNVRGAGYTLAAYPTDYPTPALDSHVLRT